MSTTITAGNPTNGLALSSDNTGILEFKTGNGAGTTALTLSTSQVATFANAVTSAGLITGVTGALYPIVSGNSQTAPFTAPNTYADFTGIPSWVKRITVMFSGVSTSSTSNIQLQLGTGAGPTFTTSGYLGAAASYAGTITQITSGFLLTNNTSNVSVFNGMGILTNLTGNTWTAMTNMARSDTDVGTQGAGSVPLSAVLTAIRITTINGTNTFDAGSINILYE